MFYGGTYGYCDQYMTDVKTKPHSHAVIGTENNAVERYGVNQVVHRYLCGFVLQWVYADRQHFKQNTP